MSSHARNRRPSPADLTALSFLAEHRVGISPQLALVLGVSRAAAERRVRRLAGRGLVTVEAIFSGCPQSVRITRAGLRTIASPLPVPSVNLKGSRHDVGVGWLWLAARDGVFGELAGAVSERRMQSADARLGRRSADPGQTEAYGVGIGGVGPTGLPQRHYPDLLLQLRSGHLVAVELELTAKGPRRLQGIVRGYAGDPRIDSVLYLVPDRRIGDPIAAAARRVGVSELIAVRQLGGGDSIEGTPRAGTRALRGRAASLGGVRLAGSRAGAGRAESRAGAGREL